MAEGGAEVVSGFKRNTPTDEEGLERTAVKSKSSRVCRTASESAVDTVKPVSTSTL